jgi:hypothetical protein
MIVRIVRTPEKSMFSMGFADGDRPSSTVRDRPQSWLAGKQNHRKEV